MIFRLNYKILNLNESIYENFSFAYNLVCNFGSDLYASNSIYNLLTPRYVVKKQLNKGQESFLTIIAGVCTTESSISTVTPLISHLKTFFISYTVSISFSLFLW